MYRQISFDLSQIREPQFAAHQIYASDFKNEKNPIQKAVDACAAAGGGQVIVDSGEWQSGPIHLHSNIHLHLCKGCSISFSDRFSDYLPPVLTRWEGAECYNYSPLIYARDCKNIAITGEGVLYGNGEVWWHFKMLQQEAANELCYAQSNGIPVEERVYGTEKAALRPSFIQFFSCENILIQGITLKNGPQWTLHPVYCKNVTIREVKVRTEGPNTDGLNPDSCENVLIESCEFDTGDDCIAINSGINEDGWRVAKPCRNIFIQNCRMTGGHGGLVIGSAMSGGVEHIYARNCEISGTDQGIRLKSMRGRGGCVKDVWFEDIKMKKVKKQAVQISMFYPYSTVVPKTQMPPAFSEIHISNIKYEETEDEMIKGRCETALELMGLPERALRDIFLKDISLCAQNAFVCKDTENLHVENVTINGFGRTADEITGQKKKEMAVDEERAGKEAEDKETKGRETEDKKAEKEK